MALEDKPVQTPAASARPHRLAAAVALTVALAALPGLVASAETRVTAAGPSDGAATVYDLGADRGRKAPLPDAPLRLEEKILLPGLTPGMGRIETLDLSLALETRITLAGSVGDGLPLDEAGETVATAIALPATLSLHGPDGALLATRTLGTVTADCKGRRACAFAADARETVHMALAPALDAETLAAFARPLVPLTLRIETAGGVRAALCPEAGAWGRCRVQHARVTLAVPEDGLSATYGYVPAAPKGPAKSAVVLPGVPREGLLAALGALVLVAAVAGFFSRRLHP